MSRLARLTAICLVGTLAVANSRPARAFDLVVTKVADTAASCEVGDCSLREAILAANAVAGADHITVPAGAYILSIPGVGEDDGLTGDLDITDDLVIEGAGASVTVVRANKIDRVFDVHDGIAVEVSDLDIQGGSQSQFGGGLRVQGLPPSSSSDLTLRDCFVRANTTTFGGGGISVDRGSLTLERTAVFDNSGEVRGGGIYVARGSLTLTDSTVERNESIDPLLREGLGGGVYLIGASGVPANATLIRSVVNGNNSSLHGGGLYRKGLGSLSFDDSTVSGNSAEGSGGGLYLEEGTVNLTHATVSGNTAVGDGGGIDLPDVNINGSLVVVNSTVSGNTAGILGGGIHSGFNATLTLESSTVSDNGSAVGDALYLEIGSAAATDTIIDGSCSGGGTFIPAIGNIESPGDTCGLGAGNQVGVSAAALNLGPLANYGGLTMTHLPFPASVAIDTASDCPPPSTDQRGQTRPVDGDGIGGALCDVGSVEVQTEEVLIFFNGFESGDTSGWS